MERRLHELRPAHMLQTLQEMQRYIRMQKWPEDCPTLAQYTQRVQLGQWPDQLPNDFKLRVREAESYLSAYTTARQPFIDRFCNLCQLGKCDSAYLVSFDN